MAPIDWHAIFGSDIVIAAGIALIGTVVSLAGSWIINRRHLQAKANLEDASASLKIVDSSLALIEPLRKRIVELESLVSDLTTRFTIQSQRMGDVEHRLSNSVTEVEGLRAGVTVLSSQLKRLSITPEYVPAISNPEGAT